MEVNDVVVVHDEVTLGAIDDSSSYRRYGLFVDCFLSRSIATSQYSAAAVNVI